MDRDETWRHIDAQRAGLADFLDTLSPQQWSTPSLCPKWTVRDVAVHVTQSTTSWWRFAVSSVRFGFRFDPMVCALARADDRSPDEITAALRAMVGVRRKPPGTKVADPLMDVLVHSQDIAIPLGIKRAMPIEPAVVVAERLWGMTFPINPKSRFPHVELVATDADFHVGSGERVSGAIADVVMALAGRRVVLERLSGPIPSAAYG
jgi:uncharacterized protein (TIGR03083 family)